MPNKYNNTAFLRVYTRNYNIFKIIISRTEGWHTKVCLHQQLSTFPGRLTQK